MRWTGHVILTVMRTASLTAAVAVACLLAACGQKGPLVLPDAQHPRKKLGVPKPAAATVARPAAPAPDASAPDAPAPQP